MESKFVKNSNVLRLISIINVVEKEAIKRPVELVYLSIVLLGYKIPEVAKMFQIPESKTQSALCVAGVRFSNDKAFSDKMKKIGRIYNMDHQLKLVA